jgi:hypothetical protein
MENRVSKRGLPHAHIIFWTDFDTQDIGAVDAVINDRYPKNSPFFNDQGMVSNFHQLIDAYQIHYHSKRCRLPNGKCQFGYPQAMADTQEYVVTTIIWPGMQKKDILCLIILRCWHPFELIIVSK